MIRFDLISFQFPRRGRRISCCLLLVVTLIIDQRCDIVIVGDIRFFQQNRFPSSGMKSFLVFPSLGENLCVLVVARFLVFQISGDVVEICHSSVLPLYFHVLVVLVDLAAPGVSLDLSTQEPAVSQERVLVLEDLVTSNTFEL